MDFTVVVATFGENKWRRLAQRRAVPSAQPQAPVVAVHGASLHEARNEGLAGVKTEFVVFLDADDELAPGYIEAMRSGTADLRAPMLQWVPRFGRPAPPFKVVVFAHHGVHDDCTGDCLRDGNFLVIGTAVRTELAQKVGGFEDWAYAEDRAFFARCWLAGGTVETIPAAVYRAHVRKQSRNRGAMDQPAKDQVMAQIDAAVFGDHLAAK